MTWIVAAICYAVSALLVALGVRVVDDPYGHLSPRSAWTQAILAGIFWPFLVVYFLAVLLWE